MVNKERLEQRRRELATAPELTALLATVRRRVAPVLERPPLIPEVKALLSMDGGVCPDDRTPLVFDPGSPEHHACPRCGKSWSSEHHHRRWVRYQHLWVVERAADLAAIAVLANDAAAAARARDILQAYGARYFRYPNSDNVLGPSRLFFSTYLESLWLCSYLAAAVMLREGDLLDTASERAVALVADEAANLIGEFDERFSNRQTWNNAALTAIAVWFGDEDLAQRVIGGPTGLAAHLAYGFRGDGLWYEGENYHLFALRGLLVGFDWARAAASSLLDKPEVKERIGTALLAPSLTALPDFTFPARKDSRFGVSLALPVYLDTWETGLALLGPDAPAAPGLTAWLRALYGTPAARPELFESYLHDAPLPQTPVHATRDQLSWWSLLHMVPTLPPSETPRQATTILMEDQGLAVLRAGNRYVSLEAGPWGGGHGHHDRLHLTVHAGGVHWLPDPGTGSYVADDLFWYRSTLAHNVPRLDGRSQTPGRATCDAFQETEQWSWAAARFGEVSRSVVTGPDYVVDVVELASREDHVLELPWHIAGEVEVASGGRWTAAELDDPFVRDVERLDPVGAGAVVLRARRGESRLVLHVVLAGGGELLRMRGPGLPRTPGEAATFYVARARGRNLRLVTILETTAGAVRDVRTEGELIEVRAADGVHRHRPSGDGWVVETPAWRGTLRGARKPPKDYAPMLELEPPERARGAAFRLDGPPPLDGTPDGFPMDEPLALDLEDQYRRSEEGYPGPEDFSASAALGWDETALYLCVDVVKTDLVFRPAGQEPLRLDNDPDDVHSDGLQIYLGESEGESFEGVLVIPESGGALRVLPVRGTTTDTGAVRGTWQETDGGYRVTLAFAWPAWATPHVGGQLGFDLIINEMLPGRQRRAGQLAWSGGDGWVWLRGDGQAKERLGELELAG